MGIPTGRVNARSGRVCMFVCANVHSTFLSKAPYRSIPAPSGHLNKSLMLRSKATGGWSQVLEATPDSLFYPLPIAPPAPHNCAMLLAPPLPVLRHSSLRPPPPPPPSPPPPPLFLHSSWAGERNACDEKLWRIPIADARGLCKTRQDTWRIKRTREGEQLAGKAPPNTMGAKTEGTLDVDGCDDGGKGREGSQGKRLSLELRLPLSIPRKELGPLDYILSLGHLRCPRTCMCSSPHGAAP